MNEKLLEQIIGILSEHLGISVDDIAIDSDVTGDLGADSLDIVELVAKFEQFYGIEITDEELMQILKVEDILNFVIANKEKVLKSDKSNMFQLSF